MSGDTVGGRARQEDHRLLEKPSGAETRRTQQGPARREHELMTLQRQAGNAAVSKLIVQREETTEYLDQQYHAWLMESNWTEAAEKLNAFSVEDIRKRLHQLTPYQKSMLHWGALNNRRVGPGSNVAQMTGEGESGEGFGEALFDEALEFLTVEGFAKVLEGGTKWVPLIGGEFLGVAVQFVELAVHPRPHSVKQYHRVYRAVFAGQSGGVGLVPIKVDTAWHTHRENAEKEVEAFNSEYADKPGYGKAKVQEGISSDWDDPD